MNTNRYLDFFKTLDLTEQRTVIVGYLLSSGEVTASPTRETTINASTRSRTATKRTRKATKRTRGPVVSGVEAQAKVLAHLNGNASSKFATGQLVKSVGLKVTTTQAALRALLEADKIYSAGERGQTRYSATKAGLKATAPSKAKRMPKAIAKRVNVKKAHANGVAATA